MLVLLGAVPGYALTIVWAGRLAVRLALAPLNSHNAPAGVVHHPQHSPGFERSGTEQTYEAISRYVADHPLDVTPVQDALQPLLDGPRDSIHDHLWDVDVCDDGTGKPCDD